MSDAEKDDAEALDAVHSWELFMRLLERRDPDRPKVTEEEIAAKPDQTWPIVRRHPVTGAKSVYVNPKNTRAVVRRDSGERLAPDAAKTLVETLGRRVIDSGVYAHEWRRGDFVIWDNRVLLHAASPFDAEAHQRLLFRMEFKGEPVLGP
jgi:taurine dioxygenase